MPELSNALSIPRAFRVFAPKRVGANCLATDVVGDCVVSTGDRVAGLYQVTRIDPRVLSPGPSWGVIIEKKTATLCVVQMFGVLDGVYTGLTIGKIQWVGLNGRFTDDNSGITPPVSGQVFVQQMGIAIASDVVLLFPEQPIVKNG